MLPEVPVARRRCAGRQVRRGSSSRTVSCLFMALSCSSCNGLSGPISRHHRIDAHRARVERDDIRRRAEFEGDPMERVGSARACNQTFGQSQHRALPSQCFEDIERVSSVRNVRVEGEIERDAGRPVHGFTRETPAHEWRRPKRRAGEFRTMQSLDDLTYIAIILTSRILADQVLDVDRVQFMRLFSADGGLSDTPCPSDSPPDLDGGDKFTDNWRHGLSPSGAGQTLAFRTKGGPGLASRRKPTYDNGEARKAT